MSLNEGMFTLNFDNMSNDYNYVVYELCHICLLAVRIVDLENFYELKDN